MSDSFQFKQFIIKQDRCAMKVGTDGVLLGAWSEAGGTKILDIGTGTGLVALMMAQRSDAEIIGIDIDEQAARQAQENFEASPWKLRLRALCGDINLFETRQTFDEIVSNPPYFENSPVTTNAQRNMARNGMMLGYEQLIQAVNRLLSDNGIFEVIIPSQFSDDFDYKCWQHNLFLYRKTLVRTKPDKPVKRILMAFGRKQTEVRQDELCLMDIQNKRTPAYNDLTSDYYFK